MTKEDSTEYAYDSNGNITKAGSTTFTYDSQLKDRLKSINGKEIIYGANPLNPVSYEGITFEWEGRRLIKYNNYMYTYNDQGLRTSKSISNVTTKYYYDGDKLITEVTPTSQLDFLYDENQQLYGFIYNNNEKYFYIRDFMQNILGIVDTNGSLVVKYGYTAYGKITSITGSLANTIGAYNPFRYKGYYYDTETNMYYCNSRYYVPEWCRWLNGDETDFTNFTSIKEMNMFSYLNNKLKYISLKEIVKLKMINSIYNSVVKKKNLSSLVRSKNSLSFSAGIITPDNYDMEFWMSIYAFYAKGSIGPSYTIGDGFSLVSFSFGVLDSTFHTPKWFTSLPSDHLANPNVYLGVGTWNANVSMGYGVSASAEIVSGTIGVQFGNSVNVQTKGYLGVGFSIDFSNGFKIGGGLGFCFELSFSW